MGMDHFVPAGVYAAMATPMHRNGELNRSGISTLTDWLIGQGVQGLVPLGTTGEFYTLTREERTVVTTTVIEAAAGRVPVVVGVNSGSTREVLDLAREALDAGAAALMIAAPYYSLPRRAEIIAHFGAVADALSAPVMLYNYPGRTGIDITPDLVTELAQRGYITAVKESSGDAGRISLLRQLCGEGVAVLCGCDTLPLESFAAGAVGWVGGGVNFLPREHLALFEMIVGKGDLLQGRQLAERLLPALRFLEDGGAYTQRVKAGMELVGIPAGPPRLPLLAASELEIRELRQLLTELKCD